MSKRKILVVDDEPDFVDAVRMRLEANDYEVISAGDGQEALAKAKSQRPDLILLDLVMPKVNGFEALTKLKIDLRTRNIPVVIITAKTEAEYALDAGKLGAIDYLVKPVGMDALVTTVQRHL